MTARSMGRAGPSPERARVLASMAATYMLQGDHARAVPAAEAAIALALEVDVPVFLRRPCHEHAGDEQGAPGAMRRGTADVARGTGSKPGWGRRPRCRPGCTNLSAVLLVCGELEQGLAVAEAGVTWSRSVGAHGQYGRFIEGHPPEAAIDLGRWDDADRKIDHLLSGEQVGVNRLAIIAAGGTFLVRRGRRADAVPLPRTVRRWSLRSRRRSSPGPSIWASPSSP